ncbi:alkene reductase [Hoeflea sp. G2-23]|uniref:Alkene reductase n=1 Tax=Hoeflea algicola TaxID=2983763 RepID=A0ABT3ZBV5_9HYPH|nr:alkene reductase [Hoeflea algicola]MCY0149252.1 alkene reductase [Hoeflea algicola]
MPQPLLQPYRMGSLELPNRVVMAPMTRNRGDNPGNVPTELVAEYYAQRASAGLLISEGTFVSKKGIGFINVPGLYTPAQVDGWRQVTGAVHANEGRIFCQLWHVGAVSHPELLDGELPLAPSAINPESTAYTFGGFKPTVTPRTMESEDIAGVIGEFRQAARNAADAGFDGVEIHAANGYLFHQFFARSMNLRTDAYGGSIENRARLLFDVIDAVRQSYPADRIGVRVNPTLHGLSGIEFDEETLPLFDHVAARLSELGLGYLHVMEPINDTDHLPPALTGNSVAAYFRSRFAGTLISAVDHTSESANAAIDQGSADLVAFGRPFISNPDLVDRFRTGAALAMPDRTTFYAGGARGYVDYPTASDSPVENAGADYIDSRETYAETRRKMKAPTTD